MSKKENNIFVRVFQWLLEEWIKTLLTIMAMSFLAYVGWIYRNYIKELFTSKYYLEMYGWTWILVFLLILVIPILLFWFITYILKHDKYTNEIDVKNILTDYWLDRKNLHGGRRRWMNRPQGEFTIHCSNVDKRIHLKKGSSAKFLPEIIENDSTHCIKSRGRDTIVVQRKGLTMKIGPDSPNGIIL